MGPVGGDSDSHPTLQWQACHILTARFLSQLGGWGRVGCLWGLELSGRVGCLWSVGAGAEPGRHTGSDGLWVVALLFSTTVLEIGGN